MSWQRRSRTVGLRQSTIARILGHSQWYVSTGIRAPAPRQAIKAIISAWEIMSPAQRCDWLEAMGLTPTRALQPVTMRLANAASALTMSVVGMFACFG